ncbi:MAG: nucleoside recognition domain-containing protein [Bdellovibrionota bacterium]
MNTKASIIKSSKTIAKLIFPIYVAVDILHYSGALTYLGKLFSPLTTFLGLPSEAALALAGGGFFNLYTGIALAAPLGLTSHQWTVVAVFLGLFHSIIIEAAVLKKLQIPVWMTFTIRLSAAIFCAWITSRMGTTSEIIQVKTVELAQYSGFGDMLLHSVMNAFKITAKVMILIALIIYAFDSIKKSKYFGKKLGEHSWFFNLIVGLLLGVTYGAGLLLNEGASKCRNNLPTAFFLLLCHGIIEETVLFTMFGASALPVILSRLGMALVMSSLCIVFTQKRASALQEKVV